MGAEDIIKSVSYDQQEIINNILKLYNKGNPIDFDPCYNVGSFYKNNIVRDPEIKSDIAPLMPGVIKLDVRELPFTDKFNCIIFDPPFIIQGQSGKIGQRYGQYDSLEELLDFYDKSLDSLYKALKRKGILIVKCQNQVNGRRNFCILNYVQNMAREKNFKFLDLFILIAKSRAINMKNQQHARKFHSYFVVFKKKTTPGAKIGERS